MDTLNLNMKAPTGVFRKFHGKELDLKEQYIYIKASEGLLHDFLCISTASQPTKSPRHSLPSYPSLMTVMCLVPFIFCIPKFFRSLFSSYFDNHDISFPVY